LCLGRIDEGDVNGIRSFGWVLSPSYIMRGAGIDREEFCSVREVPGRIKGGERDSIRPCDWALSRSCDWVLSWACRLRGLGLDRLELFSFGEVLARVAAGERDDIRSYD